MGDRLFDLIEYCLLIGVSVSFEKELTHRKITVSRDGKSELVCLPASRFCEESAMKYIEFLEKKLSSENNGWISVKKMLPETVDLVEIKYEVAIAGVSKIEYDHDRMIISGKTKMFAIEQHVGIEVLEWRAI